MIQLDSAVLSVLSRLQAKGKSYVVGGYLRDKIAGADPSDVDIATEIPIQEVKALFPSLSGTEKGLAFGVGRFQHRGLQFEVSCHEPEELDAVPGNRDFSMNCLRHDGSALFDPCSGVADIESKIIRSVHDPLSRLSERPEEYLRAIRLAAKLGFELEAELFDAMRSRTDIFFQNGESRIQLEGHKTLASLRPLKALQLLQKLGLLEKDKPFHPDRQIPHLSSDIYMRFAFVASLSGPRAAEAFVDLYRLSKKFKEKIEEMEPFFDSEEIPENPRLLNRAIAFKRYQLHQEPEKLALFFKKLRG